ncbi:MAG TPA: thioesterase family protein [Steroidobacteraceae bacterium]|nr:thioesterase family protein [Steroidobacteraceae bacterium]
MGERLTGAKRGTITIRTILEHIGTTSLRLTHRMYREWESDPVAVAELVVAHVDTSTRHGCEFPAVLRAKMRPFLEGGSNRSTALVAVGDPA